MHLTQRKQYTGQAAEEEIREAIFGIQQDTIGEIDKTDSDHDGLYDIYETADMMLPNGKCVYTNPQTRDTDGDGLSDDIKGTVMLEVASWGEKYEVSFDQYYKESGMMDGVIWID